MQRIRASIQYGPGSPGVMTLYTRTTGPENSVSAGLCSTRLKDALTAGIGLFPSTVSFVSDTFVDTIDPATGTITGSDAITPWTLTGSNASTIAPQALQFCVTWKTDDIVAGKRVRGRTFFGPTCLAEIDTDGTPKASALVAVESMANAWTDSGATSVDAVVWHRPKGASPGSDHIITSHSYRDTFAVLRSRRD